jgi:molybdate transport system substrate-binding protein
MKLRVLSAGAVKRGVAQIAAGFGKAGGVAVEVEFTPVPDVRQRILAGEPTDVVIASPAVLDEFAAQGLIVPATRGRVGRSRMGVVAHADAAAPPITDTDSFVRAMRAASAVVHNEASSGIYAAQLLVRLGLATALGDRIVEVKGGAAVMEYVAAHPPSAVGLAQISEVMVLIDKGCRVKLVAPLPDAIQNFTTYDAVATASSADADKAAALARAFAAPAAKPVFAAAGID